MRKTLLVIPILLAASLVAAWRGIPLPRVPEALAATAAA